MVKVNDQATLQGVFLPKEKLLFRITEQTDLKRFYVSACNDVCAVFTLNAEQSVPKTK